MNNIFKVIFDFLDWIFPRNCLGCGAEGGYVCVECLGKLGRLKVQECPNCRKKNGTGRFCDGCKGFYFDQLLVCMQYERGGLFQKLMIRFKYKFSEELRGVFGNILRRFVPDFGGGVVVPVPIHKKKLKNRGFNQAKLLAESILNEKLELCDCLYRKEWRDAQARLGRKGRLENLQGTIDLKTEFKGRIKGKIVILVDDVATTGATLDECSKVLKDGGVKYICGMVLARADFLAKIRT